MLYDFLTFPLRVLRGVANVFFGKFDKEINFIERLKILFRFLINSERKGCMIGICSYNGISVQSYKESGWTQIIITLTKRGEGAKISDPFISLEKEQFLRVVEIFNNVSKEVFPD